jgi:TPR repeat protein
MVQGIYQILNRRVVGIAILGVWLSPAVVAQRSVVENSAATNNCLSEKTNPLEPQGGTGCDRQGTAQWAQAGHRDVKGHTGVESALALGPGMTMADARKRLEKAAAEGSSSAQVNLAVCYLNGWGTPQNNGAGFYWLKMAAAQGDARARTNLGILYLKGWGVKTDYQEARRNFQFAAEHGETGAMVDLGFISDGGLGTAKDQKAAAAWYRQAAERGDALGQNNLADLYLRGEGVPQSDAVAAEWFEKAAAQGQTGARIKLGYMYMTGRGVRKNPEMAYTLIKAASLAGDQRGNEYIPKLEKALNAEQIAAADKRAHELQVASRGPASEVAFVQ